MKERVVPRYYTVKEVAVMLRRTTRTVYEWIRDGRLRAKRVRDGYLIPEDAVFAILEDYVPEGERCLDEADDVGRSSDLPRAGRPDGGLTGALGP